MLQAYKAKGCGQRLKTPPFTRRGPLEAAFVLPGWPLKGLRGSLLERIPVFLAAQPVERDVVGLLLHDVLGNRDLVGPMVDT